MESRILSIAIERDADIILARQRTRKITEILGFDNQDQTRITTAVSEIVRNALEYGKGGRVEYAVRTGDLPAMDITVIDHGPGIRDINAVLDGLYESTTGMGVGITGARRLMDDFRLESSSEGTRVHLTKLLPKRAFKVTPALIAKLADALMAEDSVDPVMEVRRQNHDMIVQFQELRARQEELQEVNQELQDTNRGVVALYAELEERADHLRRADQLKSRFLSNMSHEFRTPLNSILSLSRLLLAHLDGNLNEEQEKQVTFIRKAAENLTDLVNDLLDLARIEAGKTVVTPKEFEVEELFGALRGMLRPLLIGDAVALNFDEADHIPTMFSDEGKISQALRNFISNAIKFTERGEIRVWAEWDRAKDFVVFSVSDSGVGIPAEHLDSVWEEFSQVPNKMQASVKGTGLGLPLTKKIANLLRGDVSAESTPGSGSTFHLTVPRSINPAAEESTEEWIIEPGRRPILILEDNAADAFSVERALASSNYQPVVVRTVAEAKRAMDMIHPAAAVLDIMLEAEDSWGLLLELKQSEIHRHMPVVVLSTSNEERKARGFGAEAYLDKPVDPSSLVNWLDSLTGDRSVTKVLLVDDEEVSRYLIRQLLPRGVFRLSEASNGPEGLRRVMEDQPDIVLFDINMGGMDGFEFLSQLVSRTDTKRPPAIAITASALDAENRARLRDANTIISKFDLSTDVLVNAIRDAIDHPPNSTAQVA